MIIINEWFWEEADVTGSGGLPCLQPLPTLQCATATAGTFPKTGTFTDTGTGTFKDNGTGTVPVVLLPTLVLGHLMVLVHLEGFLACNNSTHMSATLPWYCC